MENKTVSFVDATVDQNITSLDQWLRDGDCKLK